MPHEAGGLPRTLAEAGQEMPDLRHGLGAVQQEDCCGLPRRAGEGPALRRLHGGAEEDEVFARSARQGDPVFRMDAE